MSNTLEMGQRNDEGGIGTVSGSIGWVNSIATLKFETVIYGESRDVDCVLDC